MKPFNARFLFLTSALALSLSAQTESAPPPEAPAAAEAAPAPGTAPAENSGGGRQPRMQRRMNFNPAEMQQRMMESVREQMGVKDDAEWALISERITAVMDLRRSQLTGAIGGFFMGAVRAGGNGGGNRGGNNPFQMSPEQDALRSAISDNLPDAEITARLAKLREARKQSEAKLEQARENLRAVLTVRQEAIVVMMGLLN